MGRPREHDDSTADRLLAAAAAMLDEGVDDLSLRVVAERVGTTTRAVYALFGSKQGLVDAVVARGFGELEDRVARVADPSGDALEELVLAALEIRGYARARPALFELMFRHTQDPYWHGTPGVQQASSRSLAVLRARIDAVVTAGLVDRGDLPDLVWCVRGLCEGLGGLEVAGVPDGGPGAGVWRTGVTALVAGLHPAGRERPV
ncbi:TetR/AcrR family transcriptional regulator [Curtobacterium flaccumfaciens pv. flaccumfaciens]|uniref:TetR/AcrR family transcriptional regulator n=1 Tax=Curtobacterium flaccumfaciens TaxID=2035 RepID=UPI001BDDDA6D|nr:TetR/AcrR family transcriptional regulator [Curtobacterium flaccumfaciens]MBT1669133.1 TetR/AcrR family transcriptional regulator [Curtobacterium flaccumfaciens pv. flaccumfaciens]